MSNYTNKWKRDRCGEYQLGDGVTETKCMVWPPQENMGDVEPMSVVELAAFLLSSLSSRIKSISNYRAAAWKESCISKRNSPVTGIM